jgi:hypothetical protein
MDLGITFAIIGLTFAIYFVGGGIIDEISKLRQTIERHNA